MKTSLINTLKIVIVGVLLAGGISYASTWVEPTQAPTGGNPDAPINIGPTGQIKLGGLTLGAGSGVSQALTILNGKAGIGFTTLPSNLLTDVNGAMGAKLYCDEKGQNCVNPSNGWTMSTSSNSTTGGSGTAKVFTITVPVSSVLNNAQPHPFAHHLGKVPDLLQVSLVNVKSEFGYVPGQTIPLAGADGNKYTDFYSDSANVYFKPDSFSDTNNQFEFPREDNQSPYAAALCQGGSCDTNASVGHNANWSLRITAISYQ